MHEGTSSDAGTRRGDAGYGAPPDAWPELPLAAWRGTRDTLHLWTQVIGKSLLAAAPPQNHWWHSALRVTSRGLAGSSGAEHRRFDVDLDLLDHRLAITCERGVRTIPLQPRSVRDFHAEYMDALASLGLRLHVWTTPVEIPDAIPFERDDVHAEYDAEWAERFGRALRSADAALRALAAGYVGKQSPVHFFWGSFDLAATRFSGRRAPERPGADPVTREAYSHEVVSFGWWPGGVTPAGLAVDEAVFYAYAAPEPPGFRAARAGPAARYDEQLGEWLLPWAAVRGAEDPAADVRAFCEAAYAAAADGGGWDRAAVERSAP
jgi:hypothetical protein